MKLSLKNSPRKFWVKTLIKIAEPVLINMAQGTLKANMPIEYVNPERAKFAHLEAVGRLICGIGSWLELGADNTSEGKLRGQYIELVKKGLVNVCNPQSDDYLIFDEPYQPLVDSAHLAEGLLRCKSQVWDTLSFENQEIIINALNMVMGLIFILTITIVS